MEIIDIELYVVYRALEYLNNKDQKRNRFISLQIARRLLRDYRLIILQEGKNQSLKLRKAIPIQLVRGSLLTSTGFLAILESMGMKQQISQLKRASLEENYNLLILLQPTQGDKQEKRYQNSRKTIGNRIKVKENTILESVKETTPFLLKPLRINILKGYNQLSSN